MGDYPIQKTVKVLKRGGFVYTVVLELSCTDPKTQYISKASNRQKETLCQIIAAERGCGPSLHRLCTQGTLRTLDGCRLDSQTATRGSTRANLQFQEADRTYAMVVLDTLPTEAPEELRGRRIDDGEYGFTMGQIMGFVQSGLLHSANTQTYTYVTWRVSKTYELSEENYLKHLANFTGLAIKYVAKVSKKQLGKLFIKIGAKAGGKMAGKTAAKAVPFLGLGCGVVFGAMKLFEGDVGGALAEVGSGAVSMVPVVGTAASVTMDCGIAYHDIQQAYNTVEEIHSFTWESDSLRIQ